MAIYETAVKAAGDQSVLVETRDTIDSICRGLHDRQAMLKAELDGANLQRDIIQKALALVQDALKGLQPVDSTLPQVAPDEYAPR